MELNEQLAIWIDSWKSQSPATAYTAAWEFCEVNSVLTADQIQQLIEILSQQKDRWLPQLFVAHITSRYKSFDRKLMAPLLRAGIEIPDASANGDFTHPCVEAFGADDVIDWLTAEFEEADIVHRIGISNLVYHLRGRRLDVMEFRRRKKAGIPVERWLKEHAIDSTKLKNAIAKAAQETDNLIERYFYHLALPERPDLFPNIPSYATELESRIAGNDQYEHLLYDLLKWKRPGN